MSNIVTLHLDGGLVVVVEPIGGVASVALNWLLPVGSATDPPDGDGQSALVSELIFRGAAGMSSREHSDALDRLGVRRSSQTLTHHLGLGATLVGDRLAEALPLLTAMVRQPAFPEQAVEAVRSLCIQSLESLEDDPQHLVMLRLREQHLAPPFNRHGYGTRRVLETTSIDALREAWSARCVPRGSILTAAGRVDPESLSRQLEGLLEGWRGEHDEPVESGRPKRGALHVSDKTAQVHLALAYDAPREADERSLLERVAVGVLSGGTSSRLFTEVRQKRSLCYSVGASFRAGRDTGMVALYAGTTPERAQETLDVCAAQIRRMSEGVHRAEFDRAIVGLKSHLIMQGESTAARAAALGFDHFRLGRVRSLEEVAETVDAITLDELNRYLADREFGPFTLASIGPVEVNAPAA